MLYLVKITLILPKEAVKGKHLTSYGSPRYSLALTVFQNSLSLFNIVLLFILPPGTNDNFAKINQLFSLNV